MKENNSANTSFRDLSVWQLTLKIYGEKGRVFTLQVFVAFCSMALCVTQTSVWILAGMSVLYSMLWNAVLFCLYHPEIRKMKIRYLFDPMFGWEDVKQIFKYKTTH